MKALLDTNILLDFLLERSSGQAEAIALLQLSNAGFIELCVTDLTIANMAYITRKDVSRSKFYQVMQSLNQYYSIIPIGGSVIQQALEEQWDDFEDSLQSLAACKANADCIITRNVKDFHRSSLKVSTPTEFLLEIAQAKQ